MFKLCKIIEGILGRMISREYLLHEGIPPDRVKCPFIYNVQEIYPDVALLPCLPDASWACRILRAGKFRIGFSSPIQG